MAFAASQGGVCNFFAYFLNTLAYGFDIACLFRLKIFCLHGSGKRVIFAFRARAFGGAGSLRNALFLKMVFVGGIALAGAAAAQDEGNHAPVCSAKSMAVTEPGNEAAIIEFNPIVVAPACSDADGDVLTVTAVSSPATLIVDKQGHSKNRLRINNTLSLNASVTIQFTVSDGKGGTTQSSVTLERTDGSN